MTGPGPSTPAPEPLEQYRATLRQLLDPLDIHPPERALPDGTPIAAVRWARRGGVDDNVGMISLVQDAEGVLRWELGAGIGGVLGGRRAGRPGRPAAGGHVLNQFKFTQLPPLRVWDFLGTMDTRINPARGLRRLVVGTNGTAELRNGPVAVPRTGKVLLFVHGFISSNDHNLAEIRAAPGGAGNQFLADALKAYDAVLAFDHATLGVSPFLNALDLHRSLAGTQADVDVVCHSRGGLVTRWWAEAFRAPAGRPPRVVFVGSPLAGTGLAAPYKLRAALNWMSNVGKVLGGLTDLASAGAPFLQVAAGLMKVVSSLVGAVASSPLTDAVVAMVPGVAAMSQVGNAPDLLRMRGYQYPAEPQYFAITADFEPADEPLWAFWRRLKKERLANLAADKVFDEPNDLIVDTKSMTSLADARDLAGTDAVVHTFGTQATVHHTNYFRQPATLTFIRRTLGIGP